MKQTKLADDFTDVCVRAYAPAYMCAYVRACSNGTFCVRIS